MFRLIVLVEQFKIHCTFYENIDEIDEFFFSIEILFLNCKIQTNKGIQSGNSAELYNISSSPGGTNSYLLDSFIQFESLARKALHSDYKVGHNIKMKDSSLCDILCDKPLATDG